MRRFVNFRRFQFTSVAWVLRVGPCDRFHFNLSGIRPTEKLKDPPW